MKNLPLYLSVARDLPNDRGEVCVPPKVRDHVLKRDKCTCQFCGWHEKNPDLRRVVSLRSVHNDDIQPNVCVTSCLLCFLTMRAHYATKNNLSKLIYLPEMSQATLNDIFRAIYVANRLGNSATNKIIDCVTQKIEDREYAVAKYLGITGYKASELTASLIRADDETYKNRRVSLSPIRTWPVEAMMTDIIGDKWSSLTKHYPEQSWKPLNEQIKNYSSSI